MSAQPIAVPQSAPYTEDANTVLLEHFDGATSGSVNGTATYTNGIFGEGVHLDIGNSVYWNLGGLLEGTVEFWGKLDTNNYSGSQPTFIQSDLGMFYFPTFLFAVVSNYPYCSYHSGDDWVGMPHYTYTNWVNGWGSGLPDTSSGWHHYAGTWGRQGFHVYIDGMQVYSNANTFPQNASTTFWAIGGSVSPLLAWPGFTGVIDELRISSVQRLYQPEAGPTVTFVKAFTLDYSHLLVGATYQLQASTDLTTWTNYGAPFKATGVSLMNLSYQRVDDWGSLFFRLQAVP